MFQCLRMVAYNSHEKGELCRFLCTIIAIHNVELSIIQPVLDIRTGMCVRDRSGLTTRTRDFSYASIRAAKKSLQMNF